MDGSIDLAFVAILNEAIDVEQENTYRTQSYQKALNR